MLYVPNESSKDRENTGDNTGTENTSIGEIDISSLGPLGQYAFSKTDISHTPVVGSAISSAIGGISRGLPVEQVGYNAVKSGVKSGVATGIDRVTGLPVGSTAASLLDEMTKENPNLTRTFFQSAIPTSVSILGNSLLPGVGGWLGGMASGELVNRSLAEGYLGDIADSRSNERIRDALEDRGLSVEDTALMAAFDKIQDKVGNISPTTVGNLSYSPSLKANDPYGNISLIGKEDNFSSLSSYLESVEDEDFEEKENENESSGSSGGGLGGPGSSGTGGDPGGGGFGIGY